MASQNHRELANIVKNVHQMLRSEAHKVGEEMAWAEHCLRTDVLQVIFDQLRLVEICDYFLSFVPDDILYLCLCLVLTIT